MASLENETSIFTNMDITNANNITFWNVLGYYTYDLAKPDTYRYYTNDAYYSPIIDTKRLPSQSCKIVHMLVSDLEITHPNPLCIVKEPGLTKESISLIYIHEARMCYWNGRIWLDVAFNEFAKNIDQHALRQESLILALTKGEEPITLWETSCLISDGKPNHNSFRLP